MNLRSLDRPLIQKFGFRYLPAIWLRSYVTKRSRRPVNLLSPISQEDRQYDGMFTEPTKAITEILRQKKALPNYFNGCAYDGGDLELYDYFINWYQPSQIIEVGCGGSTQFSAWRSRGKTKITCIDPEPRTVLPSAAMVEAIARRVEDVDLARFRALKSSDILFIDSSHTSEEASYHIEKILPILAPGVVVHHHDVYYPYDVQPQWAEQKLLLEYYAANASAWEILCPSAFAYWYDHWLFRNTTPLQQTAAHPYPKLSLGKKTIKYTPYKNAQSISHRCCWLHRLPCRGALSPTWSRSCCYR